MQPVYLISGAPGSGKTSVAAALMRRFQFGVHIPLDDLREWVVSGIAYPVPTWTQETARQFSLARKSAAGMAQLYAEAGFAVAIDDVIFPADTADTFDQALCRLTFRKVLLLPKLEAAQERNARRTNKNFDTRVLIETIRNVHAAMSQADFAAAGWRIIDNTAITVDQTVNQILAADA